MRSRAYATCRSAPRLVGPSGPEALGVVAADDTQHLGGWRRRLAYVGRHVQRPTGVVGARLDVRSVVVRGEHRLAAHEPEDAEGRDERGGAVTGRGDEVHLPAEPLLVMGHDDDEASGQAGDVRAAAASG